jgi:hypothetical protein
MLFCKECVNVAALVCVPHPAGQKLYGATLWDVIPGFNSWRSCGQQQCERIQYTL